ncbi:MAG: serpin family protein [Leptospiraceae bacterium]|nr:serpin family protein [Leptospiraceae bacterium]
MADDELESFVAEANRFAFALLHKLPSDSDSRVLSPFSIHNALMMVWRGSGTGSTTDLGMQQALQLATGVSYDAANSRIYNQIMRSSTDENIVRLANALWVEPSYDLNPQYTDLLQRSYGAPLAKLDFVKDPDYSAEVINQWTREQTNNRIAELIGPAAIKPNTRLIITNGVYFKGHWQTPFSRELTRTADFFKADHSRSKVSLMQNTDPQPRFGYHQSSLGQLLELPYAGEQLSMILLLPRPDHSLPELYAPRAAGQLLGAMKMMAPQRVDVYLPRFKIESALQLSEPLKQMGMAAAFSDQADFSGISTARDLKISAVLHKANIETDEAGSEAAAATAVLMEKTSAAIEPTPVPVFRADRPFLFLIRHRESRLILFMGAFNG